MIYNNPLNLPISLILQQCWSHSSIGLERLATDEKVEGSNPSGTSKVK